MKFKIAFAALVAALALTGCATASDGKGELNNLDEVTPVDVHLTDGRVIECIAVDWAYGGGVDCDWTPQG